MLYVDDIFLLGNDISLLQKGKICFTKNFFMKDMSETIYIIWIKIYRDIKGCLVIPIHTHTHTHKMLKWFSMKEFKWGYLPISHRIGLSKDIYPKTFQHLAWKNLNEDTYLFHIGLVSPKLYTLKHKLRERIERILYALTIRSIIYEMLCTRLNLSYILIITSKY